MPCTYRNRLIVMLALDCERLRQGGEPHSLARNLTRFPRLREPGTALVSENFAALYKVKVGDKITVNGLDGPIELEVIGTLVDYTWNRGTILVDREWFSRDLPRSPGGRLRRLPEDARTASRPPKAGGKP